MDELLSPIETIMWRVGQDPTLRMTVGALLTLDRTPTAASLTDRLTSAMSSVPRLRQLPDDPIFTRGRPAWVEDPHPDAHGHVRSVVVAAPGSMRQVLDLVALFESIPFDPDRAPWDVTLIEGLEGDRAALYLRAHHVITDGLGGIRLAGVLLDERGWPGPLRTEPQISASDVPEPATSEASAVGSENSSHRPGMVTIDLTKAIRPFRAGVNAARDVETLDFVVRGLQRALGVANSVSRQVMVTGGPLSPLLLNRSMISRFEVISVPGAREAALELGGSRNDLLVAAVAVGFGLYHERFGQSCPELRLATPASQRRAHDVGGNWFAPARVAVPTGKGHPGPQFGMVAERLAQARNEPALRVTAALASTISRLPTRVLVPALHVQADSVDFAATALPGLRGHRHICGSRIDASFPFGPRLGCPVNITAFGNDDRLDLGIALDPAAITDAKAFVECMVEAFDGFVTNPAEVGA